MRRPNNTRNIELAVGHFYRMAEKNGKAFVGEYLGQQADEFAFLFPGRQGLLYSFRIWEGSEEVVCGYPGDRLPRFTEDLGTLDMTEVYKTA